LVAVFDKIGNTSAPWAAKARTALEARAAQQAQTYRLSWTHSAATSKALREAVEAGCEDPMVVYLNALYHPFRGDPAKTAGVELKAAEAVYAGNYPAVQKLQAALNSHSRAASLPGEDGDKVRATWRARFLSQVETVVGLRDKLAESELISLVELFESHERSAGVDAEAVHKDVMTAAERGQESAYVRGVLNGQFYVRTAWLARSSAPAAQVPPEAMEKFEERLEKAREALTAAWDADDSRVEVPNRMITVCMGQGKERQRMENWFYHAINADPDNAVAIRSKMEYLTPKWNGSGPEYTGFAWQVIRSGNNEGWVVYEATLHYLMTNGVLDRQNAVRDATAGPNLKKLTYWHVTSTGLSRHLSAYPGDQMARSYFARFATEAEHYGLARDLYDSIPKGSFYLKAFGTVAKLDELRDIVNLKAPPKTDK
jgi:hypothetical protein